MTGERPGIKAIRGEERPSKRLRRELERMRRAGPGSFDQLELFGTNRPIPTP